MMRASKCSLVALVVVAGTLLNLREASAFQASPLFTPLHRVTESSGNGRLQKRRQGGTRLYSAVLSALDAFWQTSPYTAAAITCGIKASAADMIAQKRAFRKRDEKERKAAVAATLNATDTDSTGATVIYNPNVATAIAATPTKNKADWKRNMAFLVYGSLYQGATQEYIYNHLYPVWFGTGTTLTVVLSKVLFDLLIQTTTVTLPIAYLTKSVIYQYSFKEAMRRYLDDIRKHGLLKKYFMLWFPVQCITFSIVPEHYRVTFIACVSFFWLIILSSIASKTQTFSSAAKKAADDEVVVDECSFEDGNTCNIDG